MSGHYGAVFRATFCEPQFQVIKAGPVRLEATTGELSLKVMRCPRTLLSTKKQVAFNLDDTLELPADTYLVLTCKTSTITPDRDAFADAAVDRAIANLSLLTNADLFRECLFRGWILRTPDDDFSVSAFVRYTDIMSVPADLQKKWLELSYVQPTDPLKDGPFRLMSRYFAKSITERQRDEKFIYLWTMLEVWPMAGDSDIAPISRELGDYLRRPREIVKEKLGIGKLYGLRSKLLHDGHLPISTSNEAETIQRLEEIAISLLRRYCGFAYDGRLDKYFN